MDDLRTLIASRHAVLVADVDDEARLLDVVRATAADLGATVWTWSATRGLARDGMGSQAGTQDLRGALAFVADVRLPLVAVFLDAAPLWDDDLGLRAVKEFGLAGPAGRTLVLTSHRPVPEQLRGVALGWRLRPPTREEVEQLTGRVVAQVRAAGLPVSLPDGGVAELAAAVVGLSLPEAERALLRVAADDGRIDGDDVARVRSLRAEILSEESPLELVVADEDLDRAGGLARLKGWLAERRRGFEPAARDFGLPAPRGVLLVGVPGCGKSLVAKGISRSWEMPLALLDAGRLYGSFVGESESRLRSALDAVEAMAPVVLWIDELEKAFGGDEGGHDGGVSRRILGTFLRWLQERPDGVFVVATANDVERLPAELLRRGRFDEVFFLDLPTAAERAAILAVLLSRRGRGSDGVDLVAVAAATDGYSGAELEGVVVGAMYAAFTSGVPLGTDSLLAEAAATVPLSRTRAESVAGLRRWAEGRAVPAS